MRHVYGWLLLTPAAILLVAFTHYPTVLTFINSLWSKGNPVRPSRFIGLGNYEAMIEDPIFWTVLENNMWFALGTIPTSIALAIAMALLVNRALPGRTLMRMARHRIGFHYCNDSLEGSRVLHDLLPGRIANHFARTV